jgi:hypothetical protein
MPRRVGEHKGIRRSQKPLTWDVVGNSRESDPFPGPVPPGGGFPTPYCTPHQGRGEVNSHNPLLDFHLLYCVKWAEAFSFLYNLIIIDAI